MGDRSEAFLAGQNPKMMPVPVRVVQYATSCATSSDRVKTCVSAGRTARKPAQPHTTAIM